MEAVESAPETLPDAPERWDILPLLAEKIAQSGITPLEVLTGAMRVAWNEAERYQAASKEAYAMGDDAAALAHHRKMLAMIGKASEYAVKAAPYIHPRLQSLQQKVDNGPLEIKIRRFFEESVKNGGRS